MFAYLKRHKFALALSVLFSLVTSLLSIGLVGLIQKLVDAMIGGNPVLLKYLILLLSVLLVLNLVTGYLNILWEADILRKIHLSLKADIFKGILFSPHDQYYASTTGDKINLFENDLNYVEEYYFNNFFLLLRSGFIVAVGLIYLISLNMTVSLLLLLGSILILLAPLFLGNSIDRLGANYSASKGRFISSLKDHLEGMDVVRAFHVEKEVAQAVGKPLRAMEDDLFALKSQMGLYSQLLVSGNFLMMALSFSLGGLLVIQKVISLGELIAIIQVINLIITPLGDSARAVTEMVGSQAVRRKISAWLDQGSPGDQAPNSLGEAATFSGIQCQGLAYRPDEETYLLKDIDFKLAAGQKIAIVGPSGSGKSTLLKVIANVLEVHQGQRLINGLDYAGQELLIQDLVSLVHQEPFIFNDTIENNVRLYQDLEPGKLDHAMEFTLLGEDMKKRIESNCSEGGKNLSGGEKQRIGLARAILRETPVLLLDEVTSALDPETASKLEENLMSLGKTLVMVTHNMESACLKFADEILCLAQGSIIERGSFQQLIQKRGYFHKMYTQQRGQDELSIGSK